jgi:hypothetical protein
MSFVLLCYFLKITLHTNIRKRMVKLIKISVLASITLVFYFYKYKLFSLPFHTFTLLLFYGVHFKKIRRTFSRFLKILNRVYQILLLEILIVTITCCMLRIATYDYGEEFKDASEFYTYNFSSFYKIFVTLLYLQTANNTPELLIGSGKGK